MAKESILNRNYSSWQTYALTFLRVLIGWHFLYEGLVKLYTPEWTAKPYLLGAVGPFGPFYRWIAQNDTILSVANILNQYGLAAVGLGLFLGLMSKPAKIAGIFLVGLYYLAYPPFAVYGINPYAEGSYWLVNKNLIEIGALWVLYLFPSSHITGIDRFIFRHRV